MIEIFLFIYCASFSLSILLLAWNLNSVHQRIYSIQLARINLHLKKINLFWSVTNENIQELQVNSIDLDSRSAYRSRLLMGLLGFASLPGFLLFLVLTLSLGLIKNPLKMALFESELATAENLSEVHIKNILQKLT